MNITQIADELYRDLDSPTDFSIASIAFWLQGNIGKLNNLLNIAIELDSSLNFVPELIEDEKVILKNQFKLYYYEKRARENLGSSAFQWVEVTEGDTTIRRTARTEVAKTYIQLKNDIKKEQDQLVDLYKRNRGITRNIDYTC